MTSGKNLNTSKKKYTGYIFSILLSCFFLYLAFKDIDLIGAFSLIGDASFYWMLVFIIIFMIAPYARAIRWKYMIHSVKPKASVINLFGATMIGYGVNCVIPRLGEIYKALFLGRWENISRSSMFGTVIVERVLDVFGLWASVLISVYIYSGNLYDEIPWLKSAIFLGFLFLFLAIVFMVLLVKIKVKFSAIIISFVNKFSPKIGEKLSHIFTMLIDGFASIKGLQNYSITILSTAFIMFLYGLNSYVGMKMMHFDQVGEVTFGMAWILMTISAFGIVIPTPGGTGSYHLITISVLTGLFGFNQQISSAYALITHFLSYLLFIPSTIFFIYVINNKKASSGSKKETLFSVLKFNPDEE